MPQPIRLAFMWHMHQPSYWDAERGGFLLPWTRLHATKDYVDMVQLLARFPRVHATFNLTPSLLDQLDAIAAGTSDPWLDVARRPAEALREQERAFLLERFFDLNHERMLKPYPRYRELYRKARPPANGEGGSAELRDSFTPQDFRDLAVWFHLAWIDPSFREDEPLRALYRKGSGYTEAEKESLLDWGIRHAGTVVETYRAAAAAGQIELTTSAYHHPILPLLIDSDAPRAVSATIPLPSPPFRVPQDAREQIRLARESHERRFGAAPRGTWPPEGAVSRASLGVLAESGFAWMASDETVLAAALSTRDGALADWPRALYRPYRTETAHGPIAMVFRDRKLSDLIGFTYAHWDPQHAAEDFVRRVRAVREIVSAEDAPLVAVILDGENCWESYPEDGNPFLRALYERIESDGEIEAVTVSEALEHVGAGEILPHVPVGSWIRSDLGIWVGHPDKNRAWEELTRARRLVEDAERSGRPRESVHAALQEIYAAEASDWFWWYGEDHPSAHRADFDRLFRGRLSRVYGALGAQPPASLGNSLREDALEGNDAALAPELGDEATTPYLVAVLDGRDTDFFEWRPAITHRPAGAAGSMHQVSGAIDTVRFGTDGQSLFLRVDFTAPIETLVGAVIAIEIGGSPRRTARAPLHSTGGRLEWQGEDPEPIPADAGKYARDQLLEVALPLRHVGGRPGERFRFRVAFERDGSPEQVVPVSGWLSLVVPPHDPRLELWSAV